MLKLTQTIYDSLRRHAEQTYPDECCGVLLGRALPEVNEAAEAVRVENATAASARSRYQIDPRDLIRIQREGRVRGLEIVGFYHSHPDHPAHWSPTDLAEAHWLESSYVITSVDQGKAAETRSFRLTGAGEDDKAFAEEPAVIGPSEGSLRS